MEAKPGTRVTIAASRAVQSPPMPASRAFRRDARVEGSGSVRGLWAMSTLFATGNGYSTRHSCRWEAASRCIPKLTARARNAPFVERRKGGEVKRAEDAPAGSRNAWLWTGPEHWQLRLMLELWEGLKARDQKRGVCRPRTDGAAARKRCAGLKPLGATGRGRSILASSVSDRFNPPAADTRRRGAERYRTRPCGKRKRKKDVTPKRTGLIVRLPFGRPISPEGPSEAIAAGRKPSEAPGKTKNRDLGNPEISGEKEKAERPN